MKKVEPLLQGEIALNNAPHAELDGGLRCIPQHYLSYQHTLASVEALVLKLHYCDKYPIFVSEDTSGIYLQVGIIGYDNYQPLDEQPNAKIVYGRKWRVEPQLPSSEIIQTAFLAVKKAREHEVRELFRFSKHGRTTTPFNNHHDIPLLVRCKPFLQSYQPNQKCTTSIEIAQQLEKIRFDHAQFSIHSFEQRTTGSWLVELNVLPSENTKLPELKTTRHLSFTLAQMNCNEMMYGLMQALIALSDRHVDEHFTFNDVERFSWSNHIEGIATLSSKTRQLHCDESLADFSKHWQQNNYETDQTRVPRLSESLLSEKLKQTLKMHSPLEGILPIS
ncbi:hypothetical protein [Litoribacillus peritrichatus]|uniref:Uncharacterized protein n=1 Tax=Litoribacillus peritrichatus TaxID=718191 RepID=A0ABP7MCB5_9GAMM